IAAIVEQSIAARGKQAGVELVVPSEVRDLVGDLAGTYYAGIAEPGRSLRLLGEALEPRLGGGAARPEAGAALVELSAHDVLAGLARVSGLPERLLNDRKPLDPAEPRAFFEERVLGQRAAVDAMVDLVTLMKAGLHDPKKPMAVLLFIGPTGV